MAGILYFFLQYSPKLTPKGRVLLDKLMPLQMAKNFICLWNPKVCFSFCKSATLVLIQNQMNQFKPSQPIFHITLPPTPTFFKMSLSFRFPHQHLVCISSPHPCAQASLQCVKLRSKVKRYRKMNYMHNMHNKTWQFNNTNDKAYL